MKVILIFLVFLLIPGSVFAADIPGVQTPLSVSAAGSNRLTNASFEADRYATPGWKFGNINRALYPGAQDGNYWLDTTNCDSCPSDFGGEKTFFQDVSGEFTAGQQYSASLYFRSPQGGRAQFVVWEITPERGGEVLGQSEVTGNLSWQKISLNDLRIRYSGNHLLRVQIYFKDDGPGGLGYGTQYQFDNFELTTASGACITQYYTYGQPLNSGSPTLDDLFSGRAKIQTFAESQQITTNPPMDVKMQVFYNKDDPQFPYYSFLRGDAGVGVHADGTAILNMFLFKSADGVNFQRVGPLFSQQLVRELGDMYDGHVVIDYSVCPQRYIMALECSGQMCVSSSTTPFDPSSWSRPQVSVARAGTKSASTGVFLIDGNNKYAAWTVVDDNPGQEVTYSQGTKADNLLAFIGGSDTGNTILDLPADHDTHCTSTWDCNNRDKQDWKKEGNYYYLIYNGANYYRCGRPPGDSGTNIWGLGIARSSEPLGRYEVTGKPLFLSSKTQDCGTSYPVVNNIGGKLYMYYAAHDGDWVNGNDAYRAKIIWVNPTATAVTFNGLSLNLSGSNLAVTLVPQNGTTDVPVEITDSNDFTKRLIVRFIYQPSVVATPIPTVLPTAVPTIAPTEAPVPIITPTPVPTAAPIIAPTVAPTEAPTEAPTPEPTLPPVTIASAAFNGGVLDLSGVNPLSMTLTGSMDIPVEITDSTGNVRHLIVQFIYTPEVIPTAEPTASASAIPTESPLPTELPTQIPTALPTSTPEATSSATPLPTAVATASAVPVAISSVVFSNKSLNLDGINPTSVTLTEGAGNIYDGLITVTDSQGLVRYLVVRFNYQGSPSPLYDLSSDGVVNSMDVGLFLNSWRRKARGESTTKGDFNSDGVINSIDYALIKKQMGKRVV